MLSAEVQAVTCGVIPAPEQHGLVCHYTTAILVPAGPRDPQTGKVPHIPVPTDVYQFPLGYQLSKEFVDEINDAFGKIEPPPEESGIEVVTDPSAINQAAQQREQMDRMDKDIREGN